MRQTLFGVLRESGDDAETARERLATGDWTDDEIAATVLEDELPMPDLTLRERVAAWLFPERYVRAYIGRAVSEISALAEERLPTVPGQQAPRPVPIREPALERMQRGLDGQLQAASDPFAAAGSDGFDSDRLDGRTVHERLGVLEPEDDEEADGGIL